MNIDTIEGAGTDLKGQLKQGIGDATGDPAVSRDGMTDQLSGTGQKAIGQVKEFARQRPFAALALAGVVGVALLNTLRGR